jgi:hypothetical protein
MVINLGYISFYIKQKYFVQYISFEKAHKFVADTPTVNPSVYGAGLFVSQRITLA